MNKFFTKIVSIVLTVLTAELIFDLLKHYVAIKTGTKSPYVNTLIGMGVVVVVFYPAFEILHHLIGKFSEKFVESSQERTGSAFLGLFLALIVGVALLWVFYLKIWYGFWIWKKLI